MFSYSPSLANATFAAAAAYSGLLSLLLALELLQHISRRPVPIINTWPSVIFRYHGFLLTTVLQTPIMVNLLNPILCDQGSGSGYLLGTTAEGISCSSVSILPFAIAGVVLSILVALACVFSAVWLVFDSLSLQFINKNLMPCTCAALLRPPSMSGRTILPMDRVLEYSWHYL